MRRVHRIRVLRLLISGSTLALVVCGVALWGIGREVWVARVFSNGPQDVFGHLRYLGYAFEHTNFLVQALSLFAAGSLVYLARAAARVVAYPLTLVRI